MGGMRTAGDLVMRMQMAKAMRLGEAKEYVADKLGIAVEDLSDNIKMDKIRRKLGLGRIRPSVQEAVNLQAKANIAELLDIKINSVEKYGLSRN